MANQYKNKVIYNGTTLIDISDTTAVQSDVASGKYFYTASGQKVLGTASGSSGTGQTATGTVTGDGTNVLEIPCDFEPDLIYVYGDMSGDVANRGITSLMIIKDAAIYASFDSSASNTDEYATVSRNITGYNESDTSYIHATYSNNTLTINTVINSSSVRWRSGQVYNYELSTIGTGGGSTTPTLVTKEITSNGTYSASDDSADGYSSVTVNVPGVNITDGMVITEWDTNGTRPKAVEIYGNVPSYMFGQYNNSSSLGINLTSVTFHNTAKIGAGAFQRTALVSITIPDSVESIGDSCFRGQTALAHYVHENARDLYGYNKPAVKALHYNLSHLEDMQLGAVGKPVTAIYKDAFWNTQAPSTAVVTIYTTGDRVDTFLTAMRTYLTAPTIVIKASESTTYNGNSYSAGDTMLTSTPS